MMKRANKYLATALLALAIQYAGAALRINEVRIDNFGADTDEYAEIKGDPGESLDGVWYLQIGDHSGDGASKGSGVVEFAVDLTGEVIPAGGYYLIGNVNMTLIDPAEVNWYIGENSFENSDNITHLLVSGYTGSEVTSQADQLGDLAVDIDDDDDGVPNAVLPWSSIIDAVGFVEETDAGEWYYGATLGFIDVGPDGNFVPAHIFRYENTGEWAIGSIDFDDLTDTVKAPNPDAPTEPTISGISTNYPVIGETIIITGELFTGATSVNVGNVDADFTVIDDSTIEVTVPNGDYGPVVVTTPGGTSTSTQNVIILDASVVLALEENFEAADSLGSFTAFSVASNLNWEWGSFDNDGYVSINGYADGAEPASDDWLVSPAIDLTNLLEPQLHFITAANFSGPDLQVWISTDYDGSSSPESGFTWTEITGFNLSDGGYDSADSGLIDLSAYQGQVVYVAFRYISNGSGAGDGKVYQISQVLAGGESLASNVNPWETDPHTMGWTVPELGFGKMWLYDANWPIVYSLKHGWLYIDATADPDAYLYDYATGNWFYSSESLYPYMYIFEANTWAWFYIDESNPEERLFYSYAESGFIFLTPNAG